MDSTGLDERLGLSGDDVRTFARLWHGLTALVGVAGLVIQFVVTARGGAEPMSDNAAVRILRYFSYFTIQSNILITVVAVQLTLRPDRDGPLWRVLRLISLVCITTTGIVYGTVLAGLVELHGAGLLADRLLHYTMPAVAFLGWCLFGPRPRIDKATPFKVLVFPVCWAAYTFVHGAITDWYPYPFTDVVERGYLVVIRNLLFVGALVVVLGMAFGFGDRKLPAVPGKRRQPD